MSTRLVVYVGPFPEGVHVANGLGQEVHAEHGVPIEVGAGQADALLLQAANWAAAKPPADDAPENQDEPADPPVDDAPAKGASRKRG